LRGLSASDRGLDDTLALRTVRRTDRNRDALVVGSRGRLRRSRSLPGSTSVPRVEAIIMSDSLARRRSRSPRTRTRCRKTSKPLARSSARTWPSARRRRRAADDSSFPLPFPRPCKAHEIRHLGASAPVSKTSMGGFGNRGFESLPLRPPARLSVAGWLVLVFGRFAHIHGGFRLPRRTTGPMRGTGAGGGVLAAAELTNGQLIDGSSSPNGARDHCPDGRVAAAPELAATKRPLR
jgi:hypothetical protein